MTDRTEKAIQQLAWEMQSWGSIEIRCDEVLERTDNNPDPHLFQHARYSHHYIEKGTGERFFESVVLEPASNVPISRYYCDGSRCADWMSSAPDNKNHDWIYIKKPFGLEASIPIHFCPEPLKYFYFGPLPLYRARVCSQNRFMRQYA
jgi:hypothetical protein